MEDEDGRLTLFSVGDDDQNIYGFAGASVEFIRRFEADYQARPIYLVENFRSSANIIAAANAMIDPSRDRLKADHPINIDYRRDAMPSGGNWQALDPVAEGRVQILQTGTDPLAQAVLAVTELQRMAALSSDWNWAKTAVISRQWKYLEPVRAYCELKGIVAQMAYEQPPHFWRLRETQSLISWLQEDSRRLLNPAALRAWLAQQPIGPWIALLGEAIESYVLEVGDADFLREHFLEWLAEWGREARRRQTGLMLVTAHGAKGLEFDNVVVLDGGWNGTSRSEDPDTERRLYYVAMTRAKETLTLVRMGARHELLDTLPSVPAIVERSTRPTEVPPPELRRRYLRLTLKDVDLGFAGRFKPSHPVHGAIAALQPDDRLALKETDRGTEVVTCGDVVVGRLAKGFQPPAGHRCIAASVGAIVCRTLDDVPAEFFSRFASNTWEVVVPELIYER